MQLKTVIVALTCLYGVPAIAMAQAFPFGSRLESPFASAPEGDASASELTALDATACLAAADARAAIGPPQERETRRTPRSIVHDILDDQAQIWRFPWDVAHGRHWKPVLAFTVVTAAAVALDPHDAPSFRRTRAFEGFDHAFSGLNTGLGEGLVPVALLMVGLIHHDTGTDETALLAGEALADAEILSEAMKNITRRSRPSDVAPGGDFADTWFDAGGGVLIGRGSFPSGHGIAAFALAAIVAKRYQQHRWVPWLAYGLAGTVGFSRVTLQAHFPSDVFTGAVLGYGIGHGVVLRSR